VVSLAQLRHVHTISPFLKTTPHTVRRRVSGRLLSASGCLLSAGEKLHAKRASKSGTAAAGARATTCAANVLSCCGERSRTAPSLRVSSGPDGAVPLLPRHNTSTAANDAPPPLPPPAAAPAAAATCSPRVNDHLELPACAIFTAAFVRAEGKTGRKVIIYNTQKHRSQPKEP